MVLNDSMSSQIITESQAATIKSLIKGARRVAVVCHMTPDGDAMGASLCMVHVMLSIGKFATVIVPDCPPQNLTFLPGADHIVVASCRPDRAASLLRDADLIVILDFNDLKRIDRMAPMVEASDAGRIVIDHHLNPSIEADVVVSRPEVSSTCALLYQVLEAIGLERKISREAAECCCTGMMTDTGNFSYNSNDSQLYRIMAALVAKGVDKDAIYTRLFNTNSESRIRLMGYAQSRKMQLFPEHQAAVITLSRDELNEFSYRRGDTESLVNVPLSIPGVTYSVFLREDEPGYVKISMRSKGDFSVKELCERYFGGGGHRNAAGGEMYAPIEDVEAKMISLLPECDSMLPDRQKTTNKKDNI